jgi:S-adenosylmethionine decarboxylase
MAIAKTHASLPTVYRCFYSRKSFMFPESQLGPHRGWNDEVKFLDDIFRGGAAYTVGKVNGDHWLLYIAGPELGSPPRQVTPSVHILDGDLPMQDYTIEILMSSLSPFARAPFLASKESTRPSDDGLALSSSLGISSIFPPELTTLDAYTFLPCGYSSNALLKVRNPATPDDQTKGEGYFTIHVTPEEGWSYASFECNVPLPTYPPSSTTQHSIPDLQTLIQRVVSIFQPGRIMMTLFVSNRIANVTEERKLRRESSTPL